MAEAEIRDKVMTMLQSLGLEGLHDRPAPLLSGGQQQRVALGRALVGDPDVLLLDEPFSNLDARRRDEMRFELKEVQARVGVTTIFITHDQSEAMILSDRVRRDECRPHRPGRHAAGDLPAAEHDASSWSSWARSTSSARASRWPPDGSPRARLDGADERRGSARRFASLAARRRRGPDAALGVRAGARSRMDRADGRGACCRGSTWANARSMSWASARRGCAPSARPAEPLDEGRAGAARFSRGGDPRMAGGKTGREIPGRKDDEAERGVSCWGSTSLGCSDDGRRKRGHVRRRHEESWDEVVAAAQEGRRARLVVLRRPGRGDGAAGQGVRAALRHPRRAGARPHRRLRGALERRARGRQGQHRHSLLRQPGEPAPRGPRPRSTLRHAAGAPSSPAFPGSSIRWST